MMDLNGEVMLRSTGIEALDARLGGLFPGRDYLLWGPAGAGKTSAALHLLGAGLEEGEISAILTQDDPADLLAHAEHIGYEFRPAMEQDRLRLLKFRLDFQRNYSRLFDAAAVIRELEELLAEPLPDRLVIDSIYPFLDGSHGSGEMLEALSDFLERYPGTVYLTVPGEFGDEISQRIYNRITAGAAGIFEFLVHDGRSRELAIRKISQPAKLTDPIH
jgi:KaiC/GvpD/RAD55 family RecA-like ATPase